VASKGNLEFTLADVYENGALVLEQADLLEDTAEVPIRRMEKPHSWSRLWLRPGFGCWYSTDAIVAGSIRYPRCRCCIGATPHGRIAALQHSRVDHRPDDPHIPVNNKNKLPRRGHP